MATIECKRCGKTGEPLDRPPLRNDLGERVHAGICRPCWQEWLQYQTALINHYGLNVRDPKAREFLSQNMDAFLFRSGDAEDIDTSKEGQISW